MSYEYVELDGLDGEGKTLKQFDAAGFKDEQGNVIIDTSGGFAQGNCSIVNSGISQQTVTTISRCALLSTPYVVSSDPTHPFTGNETIGFRGSYTAALASVLMKELNSGMSFGDNNTGQMFWWAALKNLLYRSAGWARSESQELMYSFFGDSYQGTDYSTTGAGLQTAPYNSNVSASSSLTTATASPSQVLMNPAYNGDAVERATRIFKAYLPFNASGVYGPGYYASTVSPIRTEMQYLDDLCEELGFPLKGLNMQIQAQFNVGASISTQAIFLANGPSSSVTPVLGFQSAFSWAYPRIELRPSDEAKVEKRAKSGMVKVPFLRPQLIPAVTNSSLVGISSGTQLNWCIGTALRHVCTVIFQPYIQGSDKSSAFFNQLGCPARFSNIQLTIADKPLWDRDLTTPQAVWQRFQECCPSGIDGLAYEAQLNFVKWVSVCPGLQCYDTTEHSSPSMTINARMVRVDTSSVPVNLNVWVLCKDGRILKGGPGGNVVSEWLLK